MISQASDRWWEKLSWNLVVAAFVRLILIAYGLVQDKFMLVKYTDIDYIVFTDAARFMSEGESPYLRSTYRYTPMLAFLLQPNIFLSPIFGKLLFSLFDILIGYVIYRIVSSKTYDCSTALVCTQIWFFNPVTLAVSTRGNAESFIGLLVLGTLFFLGKSDLLSQMVAGLLYGLAVHVKIYPVTYVLAIYLHINSRNIRNSSREVTWKKVLDHLIPGIDVAIFALSACLAFCGLTGLFYVWYGDTFLHETYLYHLKRRDIRHNFSPYFYLLYLLSDEDIGGATAISLAMFLPQVILMIATAARYHRHVEFACFLQTFIFVAFNKVCTSQYFLWYLCLLPLVVPDMMIDVKKAALFFALWLFGQGLWLLPAYFLEFQNCNTFLYIWLAGLSFFLINSFLLGQFIINFKPPIDKTHRKIT